MSGPVLRIGGPTSTGPPGEFDRALLECIGRRDAGLRVNIDVDARGLAFEARQELAQDDPREVARQRPARKRRRAAVRGSHSGGGAMASSSSASAFRSGPATAWARGVARRSASRTRRRRPCRDSFPRNRQPARRRRSCQIRRFGRSMTVIRDRGALALVNTMRLDAAGLAQLDELGHVEHIAKLGFFHGRDDAFYADRCGTTVWAVADMPHERSGHRHGARARTSGALLARPDVRLREGVAACIERLHGA